MVIRKVNMNVWIERKCPKLNMELFLFVILVESSLCIVLNNYCKPKETNTPCMFRCKFGIKCGFHPSPFKVLTMEERECVLDEHNLYRDKMARGDFADMFLPKTSNMLALSYDKEAEFIASCYIKQCIWAHDKTRLTLKGENLGQNLYSYSVSVEKNSLNCKLLRSSLASWVDNELKFLNKSIVDSWGESYSFLHEAGHLTQVLWSTTKYVGCAMNHSKRKGKSFHVYDVFCDYRPAGNFQNKPMYQKGEPATNCAPHKANNRYKHLCGPIRPITDDKYLPPTDAPADMQFSDDNAHIYKSNLFLILINILLIL